MIYLLLLPVVFYFASLLMAIRYLNKRREVSATIWTPSRFSPWEEEYQASCEWKRFSDATDGDWASCPTWQTIFVKPWQPSVWRKLNPNLYREQT